MSARETAVIVKDAVGSLGGGFMLSPEAKETARSLGLRGWDMYFIGRAGVLGDAAPEAVASVLAYFPAKFVHERWTAARAVLEPADAVARFAACGHAWARARLDGLADADRLADLMRTVADKADPTGLPLFAGWRRVPAPEDPVARVVHYAHVLREHRGGLHTVAVLASGISPLQAMVAGPYGAGNARFFQWEEPYPVLDEALRQRRGWAEELTDDLAAAAYSALDRDQAGELVDLLCAAQRLAFSTQR